MLRAFLLGLAMGTLVSALPSCGPTQPLTCLKSNCAGCCDINGDCQPGTELFACGSLGNACSSCSMVDTCEKGLCVPPVDDGGLGGGAGGGSGGGGGGVTSDGGCGPTNCNGCCEASTGLCRGGNLYTACGMGGGLCAACPNGQTCINFACQAFHCPGCTDTTGACLPGNQNQACGVDAGACAMCPTNQTCLSGACVTATTCGPANCNGCCDGTVCVGTPTAMRCGSGGNACTTCSGTQTCVGGTCSTSSGGGTGGGSTGGGAGGGSGGGGSTGSCSPLNCSGCCDGQGVCQPGDQKSACGVLGASCQSCTFCLSGICI